MPIEPGSFVELRGRHWLVESLNGEPNDLQTLSLSCISDDAQGERLEVLWDAEIGKAVLDEDGWRHVGHGLPDRAEVLAAHLRAIRWRSATAADRDLLQAPFRAGIRLDAYQLLPLRKALRLPRVNLLIADDVGLGKTIEAGLVARELLLRRRIDFIVIAAPPSMTVQWRDELEAKFGLSFDIIDRERIGELRRLRGFSVNPWATGSRFIVSHRLLADEVYAAGLRDALGEFRARALFILDEAHHAAPSAGVRYAVSSQLTKAVRELAERFEHRLFLTATPHNGHSNSFSALLEMLDPQRFTRGVEVRPRDLEPVMVRRLKADLRRLGEAFPERIVEPIPIAGLPEDAPELDLARRLADYGVLRMKRIAGLPAHKASMAKLAFVGLQQRLLSSVAAFARTLKVHRATLLRVIEGENAARVAAAAQAFVEGPTSDDSAELGLEDQIAETAIDADDDATAEAATALGVADAAADDLRAELAAVEAMLALAERHASRPDARVDWLVAWIKANLLAGSAWNRRRLIVFTEYEDTRRWLERRLREALADTDRADDRIGVFTGATGPDRREEVKRAFNADPDIEPLRILICTDAAREGINLQAWCADLVHLDLPWNPSRLEQRNGRIDRKLQPAKQVFCRYFHYEQREADIVLEALVRKTETIREQLGSAGKVIEDRIARRLAEGGIGRGQGAAIARAISQENDAERLARARAEMDDEERARHERLLKEQDDLRRALERSRERVGVDPDDLQRVAAAALSRVGLALDSARGDPVGKIETWRLDPAHPAFARDAGWGDTFDDLRVRPRKRGERLGDWRRDAPLRAIAFEPPVLADGRDATDVVQVHLEHRLIRRLLSRFLSQGFQSKLSRVSVIVGPGAQPRVVLMGRLAVYGAGAARLHEEVIPVAAVWSEAERDRKPLRPLGDSGEEKTLNQLEDALREAREAPGAAVARIQALVVRDIADLVPTLERIAAERLTAVGAQLSKRGEDEARSLSDLLERQRSRIAKAAKDFDPDQYALDLVPEERREREADRRHWEARLGRLDRELRDEPRRLRDSYKVRAHRLEPVGLVYLWPASG
ncbi:DEAD/DEAH box helicase [Vineibacter terrae]|uniref:DEAD/DEAH box helicase n=1 Tax=Vineibacter terrae TaxID=2586908 RepID=A0A5C8PBQ7_9HYPH|nr:DISARM system SNF2-like helicase DrmD [Vineibacter terrae]TXL71235.1 DEAD/DEAH box helicase [Vineibacter terrae]